MLFHADYPDIFFVLVAIVKKKILKTLPSKIIKVVKSSEEIFFKRQNFKKINCGSNN